MSDDRPAEDGVQAKSAIKIQVTLLISREDLSRMSPEHQATLAYDAFGIIADQLSGFGFEPDLVASAANELAFKLVRLDGSPPRVTMAPKTMGRRRR